MHGRIKPSFFNLCACNCASSIKREVEEEEVEALTRRDQKGRPENTHVRRLDERITSQRVVLWPPLLIMA